MPTAIKQIDMPRAECGCGEIVYYQFTDRSQGWVRLLNDHEIGDLIKVRWRTIGKKYEHSCECGYCADYREVK